MTTEKCKNCSDDFNIVYKHNIYVRMNDKHDNYKQHYLIIGDLCFKCSKMNIKNTTDILNDWKLKIIKKAIP